MAGRTESSSRHGHAPTAHIDSSHGRDRLPAMRAMLLDLSLREHGASGCARDPAVERGGVTYVELPRNITTALDGEPTCPGPLCVA